jgi:hypothetical protein
MYRHIADIYDSSNSITLGPYGGFYFIADAFLAFPFFGTLIVSFLFGKLTRFCEVKSFNSRRNQFIYITYLNIFFFVFIKHQISQSSHFLFLGALIAASVYKLCISSGKIKDRSFN